MINWDTVNPCGIDKLINYYDKLINFAELINWDTVNPYGSMSIMLLISISR